MTGEPVAGDDPRADGTEAAYVARNPGGWVALAIMFGMMLVGQLSSSFHNAGLAKAGEFESRLKGIVRQEHDQKGDSGVLQSLESVDSKQELLELDKEMSLQKNLDVYESAVYAATLTEEKKQVPALVYGALEKGKMDSTRAIGQGEAATKLSLPQAQALAARMLKSDQFVAKLAAVQTLEKAGDTKARARLIPGVSAATLAIVGFTSLLLVGASVLSWFGYFAARSSGMLHPLGLRNGSITPAQADRFAVRAAQFFGGFIVLSLVVELCWRGSAEDALPMFLEGVATLAMVFLISRLPLDIGQISLASLGVTKDNLAKNIGFGVAGFAAELPVAIALSAIVSSALKFLPSPDHPASQELQTNHHPATVAAILFSGTIVAAFWEEIMFRGLFFPALAKVFKSVPVGALVSSFLFASIHPQGLAMWPSLCVVGLMSCALSYQTRSLVPSIVMHFCHNASLMVITLLIS